MSFCLVIPMPFLQLENGNFFCKISYYLPPWEDYDTEIHTLHVNNIAEYHVAKCVHENLVQKKKNDYSTW